MPLLSPREEKEEKKEGTKEGRKIGMKVKENDVKKDGHKRILEGKKEGEMA